MASPKVCVLRAPGTNCDEETAFAFDACGASSDRVHLFRLLENPGLLSDYQILCIPGGFSYGDDVGAGVVFGSQLRSQVSDAILEFLKADKLCLGICNGFQVLLRSGILPGGAAGFEQAGQAERDVTLTWNENGMYTDLWVNLKVASSNNVFLKGIDQIEIPLAHAEGRVIVKDAATLDAFKSSGQIALQYADSQGNAPFDQILSYPQNPNGSIANIAGLGDPTGRVLGLMPHPERFIHATQHPQWTRRNLRGDGAGLKMFQNAVEYFSA
ncbi:MAG: phosphoribosylformylglycinamidine synthase I [Planctomycetaceae bacterium]